MMSSSSKWLKAAMLLQTTLLPIPEVLAQTTVFTTSSAATSVTTTAILVTTTAPTWPDMPEDHWLPDRPDQYVCEYLGENGCWSPTLGGDGGPYMGFESPRQQPNKTCVVEASHDPLGDDSEAIRKAFRDCQEYGHVVFENTTYYVASVLNTTGLKNVDVEIRGTLVWNNTDIDYWRNNSLYIGFQNQSTAWFFGGDNIHFFGHGYGTLDGNGQVWYNLANGTGNLHGRPHAITISDTTNSVIEGLRFLQSQMWTMTVARSERVLLQDIYVNSSCAPDADPTLLKCTTNTDGCDTVYANNITFLRWTIDNGDDKITMKQNSTNIYVADSYFYNGDGIAFGSIGQYPGQIEVIENVTVRNIYSKDARYACRVKTWTGLNKGYPPQGGGGGIGHVKNVTCENFTMDNVTWAWSINQKTSYNGQPGGYDTSRFQIRDVFFGNSTGTVKTSNVGAFQCSAGAAELCSITLFDEEFTVLSNGTVANGFLCDNVAPQGFNCTAGCGDEAANCPS